jgi:glycosyltransferase involved in cell wall biosynthesis
MGSPRYLSLAPVHVPQIAAEVTRFLGQRPGPHLIHGFGVWGWAGVRARKSLRRRGIEAIAIVSAYTTNRHESRARIRGLTLDHGLLGRIGIRAECLWIRTAVAFCEDQALAGSQLVLVNYESVRRLLPAGRRDERVCRKLPYTSESAFLHEGPQNPPVLPASLARLGSPDVPLLVAVSRHDPRKGIDVLLHALARLRRHGMPFRACLVGGGTLLQTHRQLAARLGLSEVISIEGFVDDVFPYLANADIFVLPSLEEGSGSLSLIEALQAGLAVVASGCDGIPEDVADGDSALLVPPGDVEALAGALRRVLRDSSLRRALACRARETFAARFSAAAFTEALADTYAALAAAARGRS